MKTKLFLLAFALVTLIQPLCAENEIGFIEKFALAADREKALAELAPGTEDFFFYHALHFQNTKNAAKLTTTLDDWRRDFPTSSMRDIIDNREALLAYDADPQRTLEFLKKKLNLHFNHQQEVRDKKPDLPTVLDPARISRDVFLREALRHDDLSGVSERELEQLVRDKTPLRLSQTHALLSRMTRPDVAGLVEVIAAEINRPDGTGFGAFPIHQKLLPEQLDQLVKLMPRLANEPQFVHARIRKLQPGADEDAEFDAAVREAWLDRVWAYVRTLPPAFNSLKASVLYHRLDHDRRKGVYDRECFLEYLKLPRRTYYIAARWNNKLQNTETFWCDLNATFDDAALRYGPIGSDDALAREFFINLLPIEKTNADSPLSAIAPYTDYVNADWLKPVFAEAMIVSGKDNPVRWASLLSPAQFAELKDRVDIEFAADNTQSVTVGDDVSVDLFLKNVPKLLVRIYEINTLGFFLQSQRQLNTDLNLDGLVANTEATHEYAEPPFQRTRRSFAFPELKGKRGAWIIEFIGGGRSSRALIRAGQWHLVQRTSPAGDMLTVLDEKHAPVKDAAVWLDGRKFTPDSKTGLIIVPFTAQPNQAPIVLADASGSFATLTQFWHHCEDYKLDAQFYLNREQILARREATLAIRSALLTGGTPQPLSLLKDVKLTITTTTLDGVNTTNEVKTTALESDKLFTHTFTVPDRVQSVTATLSGSVEQLAKGNDKTQLSENHTWQVNQIDQTDVVDAGHISKFGDAYVFELLGRNGEPEPDKQVVFSFHFTGYEETITASLRTDAKGRVMLGSLAGISNVGAQSLQWTPAGDSCTLKTEINAATDDTIQVPLAKPFNAAHCALLEVRGEDFTADFSKHIAAAGLGQTVTQINISGLPPGDYRLFLRDEDREINIRVARGAVGFGWAFGAKRNLQLQGLHPLNIASAETKGDELLVQLANANRFTRVHVVASRFLPELPVFDSLAGFSTLSPASEEPEQLPNLYSAGREIGDEYRYILDRRFAKTFPGNMLTRPSLLLNPWEKRITGQTSFGQKHAEAAAATHGGRDASALQPAVSPGLMKTKHQFFGGESNLDLHPNLDFLASTAPVLFNLIPDKDGIVRVPRKLFGDRQFVEVYAEDLSSAVQRHVSLPEADTKFQDLRLVRTLDPAKPFSEKKQSTVLQIGGALTLADIRTSELESYDTLGGVFSLYTTLSGNSELAKFAWILEWPKLKDDEKRAKYSEFACHELSFFLSRKDPKFFEQVIKPYLGNKKEKTFLDEYLLGADLHRYLEPWRYAQLNAAERALLGRRLPEETTNAARHLRELWEMLVPNLTEQNRLFETALHGHAMKQPSLMVGAEVSGSGITVTSIAGLSLGGQLQLEKARAMKAAAAPAPMATPIGGALGTGVITMGATSATEALNEKAKDSFARAAGTNELAMDSPVAPVDKLGLRDRSDKNGDGYANLTEFGLMTDKDLGALRRSVRAYYRQLGPVKEWAENNYWHLPLVQQGPNLITVNAFWRDLAEWDGKGAFVSPNLAEAHLSFAEIMLALGVLDLPFDAPKHETKTADGRMTITAGGPAIVFHKEILLAAAPAAQAQQLLVSQAFFRQGDRYRMEGNVKFDKYITTEFLTGAVYGANIVVTNPASAPADLDLLLQIPQGALPVLKTRATASQHVLLEPYTTKTFEYYFYFPQVAAGGLKFAHYPVNTSVRGTAVAAASAFSFNVVNKLTEVDKASWDYVSQYGTDAEALAFLIQNNIERLNLTRVAWRCRQRAGFFRSLVALLQQRHHYDATIYSYAVLHNETAPLVEFLKHRNDLINRCGAWFDSRLVRVDPIERRSYEQLEYWPLVNQRAHRIGAERRIVTPEQLAQYEHLLRIVAHKPALDALDEMSVVYHLFLQDRVEEALARFHEIKAETLPTKLQHDYFKCYADLYEGNLADARGIAMQHANEPVTRWRELFAEVTSQLDEIEGKGAKNGDKPDREKAQAALAATEPTFDFKIEKQTLALSYKNLREITVNYYLMDPEFAFSSSPFVSQGAGRFSIIKPNRTTQIVLPVDRETLDAPLPGEYAKANVLIEVLGAGQRKAKAHHANTLKLAVTENYGRLEVRDSNTDKPLPKTYVKIYARLQGGTVRFFKDGYTDLRGRFDYASLNSPANPPPATPHGAETPANGLDYHMLKPGELGSVEKLAVLVLSETNGAEVREIGPPSE